jgi:FG-GAP-like repeat
MKNYATIFLLTILTLTVFAWSEQTLAAAPANDNFANATPLVLNNGSTSVITNNTGATKEPSEPNHAGNAGGKSVWFSFTPTETMAVRFNTMDLNVDTLMAIYTGTNVDNLQIVGYNDDFGSNSGGASIANLMVVGGTTYYIAVDGYAAAAGDFRLVIFKPELTPGDRFEYIWDLGNTYAGEIAGTNYGATLEPGEPVAYVNSEPDGKSVWYRWKAPASYSVAIELTENFGSQIGVYTSDVSSPTFAQLTKVAKNYDHNHFSYARCKTTFFAEFNKTYYIKIDTYDTEQSTEGNFQLRYFPNSLRYSSKFNEFSQKTNISIFRPSNGVWYSLSANVDLIPFYYKFGLSGDTPVPSDYDGDGDSEYAVARNKNGQKVWYIDNGASSSAITWGLSSDKVSIGDFDGDGRADLVAIRSNGQNLVWYVRQSSNGALRTFTFGIPSDAPTVGDFDGDGMTDIAVIRGTQNNLVWHILKSNHTAAYNQYSTTQFGLASDVAATEDFDGDGKTDVAVFRPSTGEWYILRSGSGYLQVTPFGASGDIPQPADYDGDGKADLGFFRSSEGNWYFWLSGNNAQKVVHWGTSTDIPVSSINSLSL